MNRKSPPFILLVDDDALIRQILSSLLQKLGVIEIAEATNGLEALSEFAKQKPDLVFLDIEMPEKNGFDTLRKIKQIDATANVVMLTANDNTAVAESCINAGAQSYIKKGGNPKALIATLSMLITGLSAY